ncbi:MAG TPA: hypothetical protein VGH19_17725 [Verrucomicrobiae bacterium]
MRRFIAGIILCFFCALHSHAAEIRAGVAKVDITDRAAGPVNDPLYSKALVVKSESTTVVLITIDAVAIGEIGRIKNDFLPKVRARLQQELGIPPASVVINASHCHGVVRTDIEQLTVEAVMTAMKNLVPVKIGAGVGEEKRISENRRLKLKDGSVVDMRRAYSMPRDEEVASVGPIDPQIGLLRVDREDGHPLAVLYNFACHPIMHPPNVGNTADYPGFASKLIEEQLGGGAVAFFVQGCGGDINPVRYKDIQRQPNAESLGNMLGLSVLDGVRKIETKRDGALKTVNIKVQLPRGADLERRMGLIQAEQTKLLQGLKPTDINFKTFLPLYIQHKVSPEYPSYYSQGYLHEKALGRDDLLKLDESNRKQLAAYEDNIRVMERLTRLNVNLALLRKHHAENLAVGSKTVEVEMSALRIGDFRLVTFPGELTVEVGLGIKQKASSPFTFVAGYSNGYIYYLPTVEQRSNRGYAQEDCDCIVAPEWQAVFESKALELLKQID